MKRIVTTAKSLAVSLALSACASAPDPTPAPQDAFFARLTALCGQAFAGQVTTRDPRDEAFASQPLVMHVRECGEREIRIPFHVGEDRSRTWVITRTDSGLRLKHDHRHEDGTEDVLTQYGGDTATTGSAERQDFPADAFSRDLFVANGIPQSVDNVWAVEVRPGDAFAYELRRPDRHFRVAFDLTQPVAPPPPPWGHE